MTTTPSVLDIFLDSFIEESRNDALKARLRVFIGTLPRNLITRKTEEERTWLLIDWLARGVVFAWLERAGLTEQATKLRELKAINRDTARAAIEKLDLFDQQTMMPIAMMGKAENITKETDVVMDLMRWTGVWAVQEWGIVNAVPGHVSVIEASRLCGIAMRVCHSAARAAIRVNVDCNETVARVERSVEPLVERLLKVR